MHLKTGNYFLFISTVNITDIKVERSIVLRDKLLYVLLTYVKVS